MKNYKDMSFQELGEAYDNTSAVANSTQILKIYEEKSDISRNKYKSINIKYGENQRQNIDYFHIKNNAALFIFIHGGYWQMRRKETFHFIVDFIAKKGLNVAFVGYTLAPDNNIKGIENEISIAIKSIRKNSDILNFDKDNIILSGWSAGAHLAVELLNEDGVTSALAISGIYDLDPISKCFLNDKLNLSKNDIDTLSPIRKKAPLKSLHLVFGENELSEIIRQSKDFHIHCQNSSSLKEIPKANHFSILLNEETYSAF